MRPLLILRPEPGASRTAARAEAMGMEVRVFPLFTIVSIAWTAPDPASFDAILLTSANAVRHGGTELEKLKSLPVHAVGSATATAARAAGFTVASVGEGGATGLSLPAGQKLLHLAGRDHVPVGNAKIIPVYEARAIEQPEGIAAIQHCVAAVHSARSGARLAELVKERSSIAIAALSPAAAEACGTGWSTVEAANQPNDEALLALAARLCESHVG